MIERRLVFRMPGVRALRLPLKAIAEPGTPLSSIILLGYGFAGLIVLGAILLVLPVASARGVITSPLDALFTATSAVTVTGLAVVDTGTHWSTFGQIVILALVQLGGLGFIVGATLFLLVITGRFGLRERLVISESMGLGQLNSVLAIVARVALFSLVLEGAGAVIFYFHWTNTSPPVEPLWPAIFHAVSAFNNSGMDIFGSFKSLTDYQADGVVLLVTAGLIIAGSTGYVILADVVRRRKFARLSLESKIVLTGTFILLVAGTLFYLAAEYGNPKTLGPLGFPHKALVSFFQSVTPRTAGFTAIDIAGLHPTSLLFTMLLMVVGGAAGSVAGGIKVNTLGVLAIVVISMLKGRENLDAFGRQLTRETVYRAVTIVVVYLAIASLIVLALSITEEFPLDRILFEALSALGTVGLTTGITPDLSLAGRAIVVITMFVGRLAPIALMALMVRQWQPEGISYPRETIRLG